MNISELYGFAVDFSNLLKETESKYQNLHNVLQHNATQPEKQPVEQSLSDLTEFLKDMPLYSYSNEQISLLEIFNVVGLLGSEGVAYVNQLIRKSDFDPATANGEISKAIKRLNKAQTRLTQITQAFAETDLSKTLPPTLKDGRSLIRVEFKREASIDNVAEWKSTADEWNHIVRGVARAVKETSDDTLVVGATRGSIIIDLAGTYAFVRLFAGIVKSVVGVAKEVLDLAHSMEDLRQKRLLGDKTEAAMKADANEREKNGADRVLEEAKASIEGDLEGDAEADLKKSIERLIQFHKKGGEVDFVAPEIDEETPDQANGLTPEQITSLREIIEDVRSIKSDIKLLEAPEAENDDN